MTTTTTTTTTYEVWTTVFMSIGNVRKYDTLREAHEHYTKALQSDIVDATSLCRVETTTTTTKRWFKTETTKEVKRTELVGINRTI